MIECDASGVGVGGTLFEQEQPMTFVSRALTSTHKRYSNIECELLAVVLVVEHLHHYIFGCQFTIHTDHSPLVNVFKKALNEMSPRLQRLLLRLSQYEMNVKYVTQKNVPIADFCQGLWISKPVIGSHIRPSNSQSWNPQWCQSRLECN